MHLVGIFGDSSYLLQIKTITGKGFRIFAHVLVSAYSLCWLGWLIWANVLRFRSIGQECAASKEGKYLLNVIISIWTINGVIVVLAIIAGVVEKKYVATALGVAKVAN